MQPIIPPLKPGESSPSAANLVEAVLFLVERGLIKSLDRSNTPAAELAKIAREELSTSTFGPATRQLVIYFQLEQRLGDDLRGVVEEKTAERLNRLLTKLGALDETSADGTAVQGADQDVPDKPESVQSVITGRVTYADGPPAAALQIKLFEVGLCRKELLKETPTNSAGIYAIKYSTGSTESSDPSTIGVVVEVYGASKQILVSSSIQFGPASSRRIDLVLPDSERGPSEYERYLASLRPILKDLSLDQLPCGDDDQNLAYLAGASGVPRDRLEMLVAAEQMARVGQEPSVPPSYSSKQKSLASVKESSASHPAKANPFTAPMFYAWMRLGESRQREEILADQPTRLVGLLKRAGDENLIPALPAKVLETVQAALLESHTSRALQPSTAGAPASLGDSLELLTESHALSENQKRLIAQAAVDITASTESVLQAAKLTPAQIGNLRQVAALHELSDGSGPLLQAAYQHVQSTAEATPSLPLHTIAGLDESAWQEILKAAGSETTSSAEIENTSKRLVERAAELLPNAFLLSRAVRQTDSTQLKADLEEVAKLAGLENRHSYTRSDDLAFDKIGASDRRKVRASFDRIKQLVNRYPGLDLDGVLAGKGSIEEKVGAIQQRVGLLETLINANPDVNFLSLDYVPDSADMKSLKFPGMQNDEKTLVLRSVKARSRAFRTAGGALNGQRMIEAGFTSATATAGTTLEEFVSATNLPVPEAAAIHANASDVALDASLHFMALYSLMQPVGNGTQNPLHSITQPPEIVNHLKRFDGFKDLFGAQAICRCQHCRSVLGPAAYFVDMMRFIDKDITALVFDNSPRADQTLRLQYRRPDLWVLPLTCENSDTLIPTLDIVNEILENFIYGQQTPAANQRTQIQKAVYLKLAQAQDSFAQPYVLPLKQVEAYLSHFRLTRAQIAETFELDADTTARAVLGISLTERDLIVKAGTNAQLDKLFGTGITGSTSADTQLFLAVTKWTRDELGQLLKTRFVQAGNAITIESSKASGQSIQNDREAVKGYSRPALDRLHRVTRLWRAIPRDVQWSIPELDLVLSEIIPPGAPPDWDPSVLPTIGKLLNIQARLGISAEQLCALFVDIPQLVLGTERSLFDRLFNLESFVAQDGLWPAGTPPLYKHPSILPATADATTVLTSNRLTQRLMAGLQVLDAELVQLLNALNWLNNGVSLDLQNLTLLYRHALLARTLKLAIPDLFELLTLAKVTSNRVSDLAGLQQLLTTVDQEQETGISIGDIIVITGGAPSNPSAYPDATTIAKDIADQIRTGHLLEFASTALSQVPGITADQSKNAILQSSAVFEPVPQSENYRLKATADPDAANFTLTGIAPADLPAIRSQLNAYHTRQVLPKLIAAQLRLSDGELQEMSVMVNDLLAAHNTNLVQELYGSASPTILQGIVAKFIPLTVLFKDKVWDENNLQFVVTNPGVFGLTLPLFTGANPNSISFDTVVKVTAYAQLIGVRDQGFTSEEDTPDPLAVQSVLTQGFGQDATVASALRVAPSQVSKVKAYLSLNNGKPFEGLRQLARTISLTEVLGLGGAALPLLVPTATNATDEYNNLTDAADALIAVLHSKYPDEQKFAQVVEPYEDSIRSRKRDGLVEYTIRSMNRGFDTASDLYQFFLIDTQVEGCARTSRLVSAHGTLQLYLQRVLMNLERSDSSSPEFGVLKTLAALPTQPLDRIQSKLAWSSTYRGWEANRKVFLYPESYVEPELRDNKTPIFSELESSLLQQRINEENATDAYTQYLEGYEEAASLKIAGAFHDINEGAETDRLHLFGATADDPPIYYYRTIDNVRYAHVGKRKSYTPWRKLNVQIPVREVSPVIFEGRLLIFWVQITTTPTNKVEKGESRFIGYQHKFSFHYSEKRANDTWTSPQKVAALDDAEQPFERIDDPLEEPITIDLTKEIPAGQLQAAVTQASTSETLFIPVPVMNPENPTQLKTVNVPVPGGQAGQTQSVPVFQLIRLGPNPARGGLIPRYDKTGRNHLEPVDGYTLLTPEWTRLHAEVEGTQLYLSGMDTNNLLAPYAGHAPFVGVVDLVERSALAAPVTSQSRGWYRLAIFGQELDYVTSTINQPTVLFKSTMDLLSSYNSIFDPKVQLGTLQPYTNALVVNKQFQDGQAAIDLDAIVDFKTDTAIFQLLEGLTVPTHDNVPAQPLTGVAFERLGTTIRRELRRKLFTESLRGLLSLDYQMGLHEADAPISSPSSDLLIPLNLTAFSFDGPFGVYFQEIFFHIPFLIADNLNSQQRFSAAQRWYHYIFDPTSSDTGPYRVWQYRKFREELAHLDSLRKALTNSDALEAYRSDPFNPHAIARLRPGSYEKAIVMKYIDNLLDWGDTLFVEFTMESLNEATMLYALAADILGPRPADVGDCGEATANPLTYAQISKSFTDTSDFLIELEHLSDVPTLVTADKFGKESLVQSLGAMAVSRARVVDRMAITVEGSQMVVDRQNGTTSVGLMDFAGSNDTRSFWRRAGGTDLRSVSSYGDGQGAPTNQSAVRGIDDPYGGSRIFVGGDPINPPSGPVGDGSIPNVGGLLPSDYTIPDKGIIRPGTVQSSNQKQFGGRKNPSYDLVKDAALTQPVFCIPPNKDLLAYWDRVEDRFYKIRNCMDITGARRQPSLYAPELDPHQLVKDKAAGLPLDDVLNGVTGNVPPYRFPFLIDKAKQYASTVQSFGSALLSALEKKDAEQLSRLRAVQEQNILKMRTRVQELEIEAAEDSVAGLERQRESVELRQTFYETVLQNGLIPWERAQQVSRHIVSSLHETEAIVQLVRAVLSLVPEIGAPTAMKYGGMELKGAAAGFASASQALAEAAESVSASAGLEATFQRRDEDWRQQKKLADKELENIKKQIDAANVRLASARRSLEVHNKSVEQAEETFQFYQDKFSNYGLYSLLSAQLQRSYREGYNAAFAVAKMVEQAYRYEREYDSGTALASSYWAQDQAGLFAGERLLLDLQNLERRYLETNYRTLEIEQSFSLAQADPSALVALRESGTCTFTVRESLFDLAYPGQYRRRMKGVRLTIPCVVGPYTSVGATLRLNASSIRDTTNLQDPNQPRHCSLRHSTVVAASTAQNDSGTFEFNFRDERYMPFEGLGAVDTNWTITLPNTFRTFDYRTISDAVLRISYTAEEDSGLLSTVEDLTTGSIKTFLKNPGMSRIFSLRHEFPDVWNQLVRKPLNNPVDLEITDRHFPYFVNYLVSNRQQSLVSAPITILLQTKVGAGNPILEFNGGTVQSFQTDQATGLPGAATSSTQGIRTHTIRIQNAGVFAPPAGQQGAVDDSKLEDILLRVALKLT